MKRNFFRRRFENLKNFFFSFFISIFFFFFFFICLNFLPFPFREIVKRDNVFSIFNGKLLFSGFDLSMQISFFLGVIFSLFSGEMDSRFNFLFEKWNSFFYKFLLSFFSLFLGFLSVDFSAYPFFLDKFIILLSFLVINCCFLEIFIHLSNKYGAFNLSSLIFFYNTIPFKWINDSIRQRKLLSFFAVFFLTSFFVFFINIKWNKKIRNFNFDKGIDEYKKKDEEKEDNFDFSLKFNLNLISIVYVRQIISIFNYFYSFFFVDSFSDNYKNWGFFKTFFYINDYNCGNNYDQSFHKKSLFFESISKLDRINCRKGRNFWYSYIFVNFFYYFSIFFHKIKSDWNYDEISKEFQKRGIYFDCIYPGRETKKFLFKKIILMAISWISFTFLLQIIFDYFIFNYLIGYRGFFFFSWLNSIVIGLDLINQIMLNYHLISNS